MHVPAAALEEGLEEIRRSPSEQGRLDLIVRRPAVDEREALTEATLDRTSGLVGDTWFERESGRIAGKSPAPDTQLNVMNARAAALVAGDPSRRVLAGDQLYIDLDLSQDNLPTGTQLEIGGAVIEITEKPHLGCSKFSARFGPDALEFVNSAVGRQLRLRGANAKVVVPGPVRVGDVVRKLAPEAIPAPD